MDKITKNYKVAASGVLNIDADGNLYISIEDGAQDVNLAILLADFDGKNVKLNCSYDEEYLEISVDAE